MKELIDKISDKSAKIGIIGLGYVGLPLAVEFAKAGFFVRGIDINGQKVARINKGSSYILDVSDKELSGQVKEGRFKAAEDYSVISGLDVIIVSVPTPLRKTKEPDISFIVDSTEEIAKYIHKEMLVVLESTTYPGTTEEVVLPILKKSGLKAGGDFYLAFSPERVDPGNKKFGTKDIPKVVGGITSECTKVASMLYGAIVNEVVEVSSTRAAEMAKLLENTFRSVNIALVNELALICDRFGIDVWEVIGAAKTKPFGFMPFYPGPGLGGHCLPIDPLYLSWKANVHGFEARFIELADKINSGMPQYVVNKIADILNRHQKFLNGAKVLVIGVTYKEDVNDIRESPALGIIEGLLQKKAKVSYYDTYIPSLKVNSVSLQSVSLNKEFLDEQDIVVIVTPHSNIDYSLIAEHAAIIFDTRNALEGIKSKGKVYKL